MGRVHLAHVHTFRVGYGYPTIRERPELAKRDASVNTFPEWQKDNLGSIPQPTARRVESSRDERASEEEECARLSLFLTLLPSGQTLHLIRWCEFHSAFHVGLNFPLPPLTSELLPLALTWAATNMGFEILGKLKPHMGH